MLVDFDSPCEVVPYFEDQARRENTYHGVALDSACRDGPVEGEVELPSRRVLMENFRRQVGEVPLRAYVSHETARRRQRFKKKKMMMMMMAMMIITVDVEVRTR